MYSRRQGLTDGGSDCRIDAWCDACRVLLPSHFSESASDMGMLRIDLTRTVKGGDGVSKLPSSQARVPVRKGLEREGLARGYWRNGRRVRVPAAPKLPDDPGCAEHDNHQHDQTHRIVPPRLLYFRTLTHYASTAIAATLLSITMIG
jgi:hypothetical protein